MKEKTVTDNVAVEKCSCYIPLKGWEKVVAAVTLYATGHLPGSQATSDRLHEDVRKDDRSGGFGAVFLMYAESKIGSERADFHEKMLAEAAAALKDGNRWARSYDYDAMGTAFFKSGVDIFVIDRKEDMFALGIHAAYVGDKPEEELAQKLETERALLWSQVSVRTEPVSGDCFSFDFEQILRKLDKVLDTKKIKGADVVAAMMGVEEWSSPSFLLATINGFEVKLAPGRVERRFKYDNGKKSDTWKAKGSVLTGLLDDSYEHQGQKEPPSYCITIAKPEPERGERNVIWKDDEKKAVLALTEKIVSAVK